MLCSGLQGRAEEVIGGSTGESWQRSYLPLECILGHTSEVFQAALVSNSYCTMVTLKFCLLYCNTVFNTFCVHSTCMYMHTLFILYNAC